MNKQEILGLIEVGYLPDWEASPEQAEVIDDLNELYNLNPQSIEYFKLKSRILEYMSMNCIEQFARGKYDQGMLTRRILERVVVNCIEKEQK